jgi:hypothetical protein
VNFFNDDLIFIMSRSQSKGLHPPTLGSLCGKQNLFIVLSSEVAHSGRVAWGVGVDRSDTGIVGSNPAQGMDVCRRLSVLLSCVSRGLATG